VFTLLILLHFPAKNLKSAGPPKESVLRQGKIDGAALPPPAKSKAPTWALLIAAATGVGLAIGLPMAGEQGAAITALAGAGTLLFTVGSLAAMVAGLTRKVSRGRRATAAAQPALPPSKARRLAALLIVILLGLGGLCSGAYFSK
jgi:hypothetical protein